MATPSTVVKLVQTPCGMQYPIFVTVDTIGDNYFFIKVMSMDLIKYFMLEHVGKFVHGCGTMKKFFVVTTEKIYIMATVNGEVIKQSETVVKTIKRLNNRGTCLFIETADGIYSATHYGISDYTIEDNTEFIRNANPDIKIDWDSDDYFIENDDNGHITTMYDYTNNKLFLKGEWIRVKKLYKTWPTIYFDRQDIRDVNGKIYDHHFEKLKINV